MDKHLQEEGPGKGDLRFQIRTYGVGELAQLYNPYSLPASATRQLRRWIAYNPELEEKLRELGYQVGLKIFTPKQVECLVEYLGEP